jgi:predicted nucleic acid-binding protein
MTLDTSVVFTLLNRKDPKHQQIKTLLLTYPPPYFIATGVLAEIAWLLEQRLGFCVGCVFARCCLWNFSTRANSKRLATSHALASNTKIYRLV